MLAKEIVINVKLEGERLVGKTSLLHRFVDDTYSENMLNTTNLDAKCRSFQDENHNKIEFQIWDKNKVEFKSTQHYLADQANAILVVFNSTKPESFEKAQKQALQFQNQYSDKAIFLVGTQQDNLQKPDFLIQAEQFQKQHDIPVRLVSSKTGDGVTELFDLVLQKALRTIQRKQTSTDSAKTAWRQSDKYKKEYNHFKQIWNNAKYKNPEEKIIALMRDYTRNNNRLLRFFSGHWNRHHIKEVNAIVANSQERNVDVIIKYLKSISLENKQGTLANMIDFLEEKDFSHIYPKSETLGNTFR